MKKKQLGNTDLQIAPIVFGGNVFGWTADEAMSFRILDQFTADGFNFIDTADIYSRWAPGNEGGESETVIGNWQKKNNRRQDIVIATKAGMDVGKGISLEKDYLVKAVEKSLKRLQTDYIDLFYSHIDDPATPVEETLEAYDSLLGSGKVRWIGASKFPAKRLQESLEAAKTQGLPKYEVYQTEYNLYDREEFETQYKDICLKNEVAVVSFFSLANGFLTGKYRSENDLSKSTRGDRVKRFLDGKGFSILSALDKVAETHQTDQASVALAWLIQHPSIAAPIASVTNLEQLESFKTAAKLELTEADVQLLNEAV